MSIPLSTHGERSRAASLAIVVMFVVACALPLIVTLSNIAHGQGTVQEERTAATPRMPRSLREFTRLPGTFKWYFEERFGMRKELIRAHGRAKVYGLGMSSSRDVLIGQDGWLFLSGEGALDYTRHARPFTQREVDDWIQQLLENKQLAESRGARYLVVIAPNKHTTYSDYLPADLAPLAERTRVDQLLEAAEGKLEILDLRPTLRLGRDQGRVFHRTDTHWNMLGGWFAACAILDRLAVGDECSSVVRDAAPLRTAMVAGGDLARLLGLQSDWREEDIEPRAGLAALTDQAGSEAHWAHLDVPIREHLAVHSDQGEGTAVIFRDSFGEALIPWLSESFARTVWVWSYAYDHQVVLLEEPDVVIQQLVERKLMTLKSVGPSDTSHDVPE